MSKMGQELEKRLDEAKYDMYEALKELKAWLQSEDVQILGKGFAEQFGIPETFEKVDKALAKVEGKDG